MVKIIGSVAFLIAMVLGGYFADAKFKAQIDGMLGKGKAVTTETADKAVPERVAAKPLILRLLHHNALQLGQLFAYPRPEN